VRGGDKAHRAGRMGRFAASDQDVGLRA
jgi:hypothetical protein